MLVLYLFLSRGVSFHIERLWLIWLFALAPYLPFLGWLICRYDVIHFIERPVPSMFPLILAMAGVPLLIGIYSVVTIGTKAFYEPTFMADMSILIRDKADSFIYSFHYATEGTLVLGTTAIVMSVLPVVLGYPFAVLLVGLLPY